MKLHACFSFALRVRMYYNVRGKNQVSAHNAHRDINVKETLVMHTLSGCS